MGAVYSAKRWVMSPVIARRRSKATDDLNPAVRSMMAAVDYRSSARRFLNKMVANPDLLVDVDLRAGAVVIDVGAYRGRWTEKLLGHVGPSSDVSIHAFEPMPGPRTHFTRLLADDQRVHLHPYGLARRDFHTSMTLAGPGSSLFVDHTADNAVGTKEVELRDVSAVLDELKVDRVDVIAVNIEGGEFELIDRMYATGWLRRTGTVFVQFHEFAPGAYRGVRRSRRQLSKTHDVAWRYPWVWERWDIR
jgi:FkbM family methyltransferase